MKRNWADFEENISFPMKNYLLMEKHMEQFKSRQAIATERNSGLEA